MQGDYNSAKAKVLKLTFEKCNNDTYVPQQRILSDLDKTDATKPIDTDTSTIETIDPGHSTESGEAENEITEPADACHSDEEITAWLRRKFIIVLQNQVRFQTTEYNQEERIVKESKLIYFPIDRLRR